MSTEARTMRGWLRDLLVLLAALLTAPLWILVRTEGVLTGGESLFVSSSELLSLFPGKLGIFLRRGFYLMCLEAFATDCHIGFGTILAHPQVRIGKGVYIGTRCTLGKMIIESDVCIGSNVDLLSGRYQHHFNRVNTPIQQQGGVFRQIRIGRNVWIGNSSVIMADIGEQSVIGAGSVVVKAIPACSVAVGNPATVKKRRQEPSERVEYAPLSA